MSFFEILSVKVKKNLARINESFEFEIFFEIKKTLKKNLNLKVLYIISPKKEENNQELENFQISTKKIGKFKLVLIIRPPNFKGIPKEHIIGINVILFTIFLEKKALTNVGYYVNNEETGTNDNFGNNYFKEENIVRNILENEPRITHFYDYL
jgi:histone chaperone ASF1